MGSDISTKFDIWQLITITIALVALLLVFYKDFFAGAKLYTSINYIVIVRTPADNKGKLLGEILLDDILSESISEDAQRILDQFPSILPSVQSNNRIKLKGELIDLCKENAVNYNPQDNLLENYLESKLFGTSFYVPLIIYNSGKKYAHISSLVMVAVSKSNSDLKWVYTPFVELNPKEILNRKKQKDLARISNIFTGFTVGPSQSIRINPYFTPMHNSENQIISRTNIVPGVYLITITGHGANGKEYFRTKPVEFKLTKKQLFESFKGTENAHFFDIEKNISNTLK